MREHLKNLAAPLWPAIGQIGRYQARVARADIDRLLATTGICAVESRYENLESLKRLAGSVAEGERAAFATFWLATETNLNAGFSSSVGMAMGDDALLWREMASRTLKLTHRKSPA